MKTLSLVLMCLLLGFSLVHGVSQPSDVSGSNGSNDTSKEAVQKVYSKIPEANALYIQGLDYLSKGRPWAGGSVENAKKALKLFRQATKKDPQFALAYVGQADALDAATFSVPGSLEPAKAYRQQEAAALKAAELDDNLPQAHDQLASIYYENAYDWAKAEREMKRVIELNPNAAAGHDYYGLFLGTMGRFEEAEEQVKLAQKLDEKSAGPNQVMLQILYWEHKDDAAIAQGLQALSKSKAFPNHFFLAFPYIHEGQFEKGIEELKVACQGGDAGSLAALAYAYAMAGDKAELKDTLERFQHHPAHDHVAYRLAAVYVALGDKDRAISLIEKDYRQRSSWLDRLKVDPVMDPLRQEPRFKELMHKMNFEQ
jgi:tetratricopeptide (TPR) repeat protein